MQYVVLTHWTIFVVNCVNIVLLTIVKQRRSLQCMPDETIQAWSCDCTVSVHFNFIPLEISGPFISEIRKI